MPSPSDMREKMEYTRKSGRKTALTRKRNKQPSRGEVTHARASTLPRPNPAGERSRQHIKDRKRV